MNDKAFALPIPLSVGDTTEIAELHRFGSFDFATPQTWQDENPNTRAIWFYSNKPGHLFGRPLLQQVILRLARRKSSGHVREQIDAILATFKPHTLSATNLITLLNA